MEDEKIIELYIQRSEDALKETEKKYGGYLISIVRNILADAEDCRECINDTYLNAWYMIPQSRPASLQGYLGKTARNIALNRLQAASAKKRGNGKALQVLEEFGELAAEGSFEDNAINSIVLSDVFKSFVDSLNDEDKIIFVKRYWYFMSIRDIADEMRLGKSKVKMTLLRLRAKLRERLEKEGFEI